MSGQQLFSFPTVDAIVDRFNSDENFATAVGTAFGEGTTAEELRTALEAAYDNIDEDVLQQLTIALEEPMALGGIAIPAVGPQTLMVAVFCRGTDLVVRYKIGSGGFLDMIRTPDSTACQGLG